MKFAAIFSVLFVLLALTTGAVVKRGSSSEDWTGVQLVKEVNNVLEGVKEVNGKVENLCDRVSSLEIENQILLREAGYMRVHRLKTSKRIQKLLSSTSASNVVQGKINQILSNLEKTKDQQNSMHDKLDSIKRESKELWGKITTLQEKLLKQVKKHLQLTPEKNQEHLIQKVLDAIEKLKEKQDTINKKVDSIKKDNKALWKEAISLNKKHQKKKQVKKGTHEIIIDPEPRRPKYTTIKPADEDPEILDTVQDEPSHSDSKIPGHRLVMFIGGMGVIGAVFLFALIKTIWSSKSYEPM